MQHAQDSARHGWWRHLIQHVREEWPATIFVAAVVAVVHTHLGWLDAIDGYAYFAIGIPSTVPFSVELPFFGKLQNHDEKGAKALVVLIDQRAKESSYLNRAPLTRCRLHHDLEQVYTAMGILNQQRKDRLDVLVVDLDISPTLWLSRPDAATAPEITEEYRCEDKLYELIKKPKTTSPYPIRTVLMTPSDIMDPFTKFKQQKWLDEMKGAGVTFGRPELPLEYGGLVIKQYCDPGSLAGAAHLLIPTQQNKCIGRTLEELERGTETSPKQHQHREYIDPRKYRNGVVSIKLKEVPGKDADVDPEIEPFEVRLRRELGIIDPQPSAAPAETNFKGVFFGAGFSEDDTFLTPIGKIYGVEVHAAGFLSLMDPPHLEHVWSLLFDILWGFSFGLVIAWCWDRYFRLKLSSHANQQLSAPSYVIVLCVLVLVLVFVLSFVSWFLLSVWGIWSSPIPIAIGMLIESFVSGSVAQGIGVANDLMRRCRPPRKIVGGSLQKFFDGDLIRWWKKMQIWPAILVALGLMLWIFVVGLALVPVH